MKIQVKFDKAAIQQFLVNQGEKVAFALVVVFAALIGYLGPGRGEPFTRTPEELTKNANYLQANIEAALPKGNLEIDDYPTKAKSHGTIDGERYVSKVVFDPPLFERRPVRGNPQVYPVEQLRGKGEIAALLVVSAPPRSAASAKTTTPAPARSTAPAKGMAETDITDGNLMGRRAVTAAGHPEGRAWVSLVGLVPFRKQRDAYRATFRDALGFSPQRDSVRYVGYQVQRLEISSPGDAVSPDWAKATKINSLESNPAEEARRQWLSQAQAQLEVVDPKYTDGVLPLVFPLGPLAPGRFWGPSVAHEPEIPLGGNDRFLPRSGSWGSPAATFAAAASAGPGAAAPPDARPPSDYRLFRFLDFHVEPGKYYMYRVSLVLANPNHKLKPTLLSDAAKEYGEKIHLQTEWSKPSGVVSVPGDTAVLLMAVTPPATKSGDPSATVLVTKWLMDRGAEEHKKLPPLLRGQIANFSANPSKISTNRPEFATDTLAVDLRGDDAPAKKDHDSGEPAEILLLTPGGNLVVRDEIDDAASCAELSAPPKEPGRLESPGRPESPGRTGGPASDALRRAFEEKGSTRAGAGHSLRGRQGSGSP